MGGTITMLDSEMTVRVFSVLAHSLWQAPCCQARRRFSRASIS